MALCEPVWPGLAGQGGEMRGRTRRRALKWPANAVGAAPRRPLATTRSSILTKPLFACAIVAMTLLGACSKKAAPPPTPESSADNAAASAPNGVGATREKLPDPINDGKPTGATARGAPAQPPGS